MNIDVFLQSFKNKNINYFGKLSKSVRSRVESFGIILTPIDITQPQSISSKILLLDFSDSNIKTIIELCSRAQRLYRKILALNCTITHSEGYEFYESSKNIFKNCIFETADSFSYNVLKSSNCNCCISSIETQLTFEKSKSVEYLEISLLCACMGREKILRANIHSWLAFSQIAEIVLVDWGAQGKFEDLIDIDNRIKIISVPNREYFNISQAYNLALDFSKYPHILKFDCDYYLNPYYNFFDAHPLYENAFYCGDWENPNTHDSQPVFRHLSGLCYAWKKDIIRINGYNEHFNGYGYDDTDLHNRLVCSGVNRLDIIYDYSVMHIPHGSDIRIANYMHKHTWNTAQNMNIAKDMSISPARLKTWSITPSPEKENLFLAYETSNDL